MHPRVICFSGSLTIVSNTIHPYFVRLPQDAHATLSPGHHYRGNIKNSGWIDAAHLKAGYQLLGSNGTWHRVDKVTINNEPLQAYNLTVSDYHSYFIKGIGGSDGVWVHNDCGELKYEPASYHSKVGNSLKSKEPSNPQQTLNESIKIKDTSDRRIAVDKTTGEFVVFDKTINNIYHGHARTWSSLTQEMKNVLIKHGLVDKKGKIK